MPKGLVNRWLCVILTAALAVSPCPTSALAEMLDEVAGQEPTIQTDEHAEELEITAEDAALEDTPADDASDEEALPEEESATDGDDELVQPAEDEDLTVADEDAIVDDEAGDTIDEDEDDVVENETNPAPEDDTTPEDEEPAPAEEELFEPTDDVTPVDEEVEPSDDEPESTEEEAETLNDGSDPTEEEANPADEDEEFTAQGVKVYTDSSHNLKYIFNSDETTVSIYDTSSATVTEITIPYHIKKGSSYYNVTGICRRAFINNSRLQKVTYDKADESNYVLTDVSEKAFYNCQALTDVELPNSVEYFGNECFKNTPNLRCLNLLGTTRGGSGDNVMYSFDYPEGSHLFNIGENCFEESGLEIVYFPSSMRIINASAFMNCTDLVYAAMPQSGITFIGDHAFFGCNLWEVTIPQTVTKIEPYSFAHNSVMRRAYVYSGITEIGDSAFYGCETRFTEFGTAGEIITRFAPGYRRTGYLYDGGVEIVCFDKVPGTSTPAHETGYVTGLYNLKTIGNWAFGNCYALKTFHFPAGLESIGGHAFSSCKKLAQAKIPDSVTSISTYAFGWCESLTEFAFPANDEYTIIQPGTLKGCSGIKSLYVPANVKTVIIGSLSDMTSLEKAVFANKDTSLGVNTSKGESAFMRDDSPTAVVYGPSGGKLASTAASCKSLNHIKSFSSSTQEATITFVRDVDSQGNPTETVDRKYDYGQSIFIPSDFNSWTKDGYGLFGFSPLGIQVLEGNTVPSDVLHVGVGYRVDGNTTLYAVYSSQVTMVNVTFSNGKDSSQSRTVSLPAGSRLTLPPCNTSGKNPDGQTGYVFKSWNVPNVGYCDPGSAITVPDSDITISAHFSTTYKVIFAAYQGAFFLLDDGTTIEEEVAGEGAKLELYTDASGKVTKLPTVLWNEHVLTGWQTTYGVYGTTKTVTTDSNLGQWTSENNGITLTVVPKWTAATNPIITFNADPGTINGSTTKEITTNSLFMLNQSEIPTPNALSGYKFNGWAIVNPSGTQQIIQDLVSRRWSESTTLYADWSKLVTKITLNKTSATLAVDMTLQLKATVTPSDADNKAVTWKSGNTAVATVSSSGLVTAKKVGTATITGTAKDGSGKKATCTITVTKPVSALTITAPSDKTYTGKALTPKPTVKDGTTTLTEGTDYTLSYSNNTNAGTAKVTIAGKGGYTGSKTVSFKINPAKITSATIATIADQPYTGNAITPAPKITFGGKTLVKGTDYTLSYSNNVKVSNKAKVTITGKGNFTGSKVVTFRIAFKDVAKSHWAYEKIHRANDMGIINGYSGEKYGQLGPSDSITRGQIAVMLWAVAGKPEPGTGATGFSDVTDTKAYYYKAVMWASSKGVVNGYSDGTFRPNDNITREQLAVMIANYAKKIGGKTVSGSKADIATLSDAGSVSSYAVSSVAWCYKNGVFVLQSGKLNPTKTADRATAAQMAIDLYDLLH